MFLNEITNAFESIETCGKTLTGQRILLLLFTCHWIIILIIILIIIMMQSIFKVLKMILILYYQIRILKVNMFQKSQIYWLSLISTFLKNDINIDSSNNYEIPIIVRNTNAILQLKHVSNINKPLFSLQNILSNDNSNYNNGKFVVAMETMIIM